ncbi:MAG: UDP-N-acetylglucosamine 1-carboxyvinyltransferase [Candidatus Dormibacter sp.]|uniref:UDP-N-acetylglucosamine 1-carboxyvinyltransferase n=1 Tax=Candidatus Dormibacter sp. TaxID=2973982 RepID=UPI003D9AEDBC
MAAQLLITGGRRLRGRVQVAGSKNAALAIMAAALLTPEPLHLRNVPRILDTALMAEIVQAVGGRSTLDGEGRITLQATQVTDRVPAQMAQRMRASIVLLGPLLARTGEAHLTRPGGDQIGARRVEQHLRGFRAMGARVEETEHEIIARSEGRLKGARVVLDLPTVTGTESLVMAATLAEGRTEIFNAAREPHVQDLCRLLNKMGADVRGAGTDQIVIYGGRRMRGTEHQVVPDYLEAGTYAIAAAAAGGDVTIDECPNEDLEQTLLKLEEVGVQLEQRNRTLRVRRDPAQALRAVDMGTWVHPGFPTDLQAQYMALMTQAQGSCVISEYIFENRFQHATELNRMGASIEIHGRDALVTGPRQLQGATVGVSDIRSGAALVIAALCAQGVSAIEQAWHLDRGYEDLVEKFVALGADLERRPAAVPAASQGVEPV